MGSLWQNFQEMVKNFPRTTRPLNSPSPVVHQLHHLCATCACSDWVHQLSRFPPPYTASQMDWPRRCAVYMTGGKGPVRKCQAKRSPSPSPIHQLQEGKIPLENNVIILKSFGIKKTPLSSKGKHIFVNLMKPNTWNNPFLYLDYRFKCM